MSKHDTILTVNHLQMAYEGLPVIENLSFTVSPHDILVILGPNGAGKTTLLRGLLNLLPYQGSIAWNARKIGYLPPQEFLQRQNLPPLTIAEFFAFKTKDTKAVQSILMDVGLDNSVLSCQFGELSTGQFQRMLIGWSLLENPDVLILDEPTSGIDVGGEETIYSLLHQFWQKNDLTILVVTHDLNIVWEYASQVLCLNKQQFCMGKPDEVLTPEKLKQLYGTGIKFYKHLHS
ncbi:metal ABC transporter ATP-binding protein [Methylicorpusculum oleiharenae]|uniref:metal ABC transporter ATP-binding protein n=1 Tax=Methylicorpusculum oleiharenae TaxID=1338687 RepID=UPI0019D26849|nr:metal ABC transporter ATP-binding protein [Methylicorpusculum oleiharenae]MCD2451687.1 metal ABC transporter ATP-binding protein [Methylicorpusculum oleiharenae]